ncbi:MAG TPA: HAMP domain-containing sensor histidine kinase [Acidimicrobiales bacterium]|nr:HAMP domain-containing sensor histidine kinase [Acidimicrobiales bacterium]
MIRAASLDRWAAGLAVLGGVALLVTGVRSGMGAADAASLLALGAGTALVAGGLAAFLLARARHRTFAVQIALVAVVPLAAALLATFLGARAMFFSAHDEAALVILLLGAGTVALVTALVLGSRIARAGESLVQAARALGDGDRLAAAGHGYGSAELDALAQQLDESARRLEAARVREQALESSRRELIAWVSHDLRTPLAGIRAIAEALEDGIVDDPDTVARYHATLGKEVERLGLLVDDLFELSRAQQGVIRLEWERFSLDELVADAIAGIRPVADAKGVVVEGRVADGGLAVHGSPPELLRALRNILGNAVRHTPADGSVVVEATVDGEQALVTVADTGGGIPEDHLDRVFDAGFRGDDARTPGTGGAGLGLAIAHALVQAHQGDITVSNADGGARFVVRFPVDPTTVMAAR